MSLVRLFIAVGLPTSTQDSIQSFTLKLREAVGPDLVRWVAPHNVHLTLKFLGDVSPANLEAIQAMLGRQALQERGFSMSVGGLGAYPSIRRPRVIWIGLRAPEALRSLQQGLDTAAEMLGFQKEQRPFSPHLTIGRVDQHASSDGLRDLRAKLEGTQIDEIGIVSVNAIRLFRSELQPAGAVYTETFAAALGAPTPSDRGNH